MKDTCAEDIGNNKSDTDRDVRKAAYYNGDGSVTIEFLLPYLYCIFLMLI
jgi:hypothetical protein